MILLITLERLKKIIYVCNDYIDAVIEKEYLDTKNEVLEMLDLIKNFF